MRIDIFVYSFLTLVGCRGHSPGSGGAVVDNEILVVGSGACSGWRVAICVVAVVSFRI